MKLLGSILSGVCGRYEGEYHQSGMEKLEGCLMLLFAFFNSFGLFDYSPLMENYTICCIGIGGT